MPPKKTNALQRQPETSLERREQRRLAAQTKHLLIDKGFATLAALGRSGALVLCAYFLYEAAGVLAGKQTQLTARTKQLR